MSVPDESGSVETIQKYICFLTAPVVWVVWGNLRIAGRLRRSRGGFMSLCACVSSARVVLSASSRLTGEDRMSCLARGSAPGCDRSFQASRDEPRQCQAMVYTVDLWYKRPTKR